MARHKLAEENRRSVVINFKLTPPEAAALRQQAIDAGFPAISNYLREMIAAGNQAIEAKKMAPMMQAMIRQIGEAVATSSIETIQNKLRPRQ